MPDSAAQENVGNMMTKETMLDTLCRMDDFPRIIKVGMALSDIRCEELADKSGLSLGVVYQYRTYLRDGHKITYARKAVLLSAMEAWRPGTIRRLYAAMTCDSPVLREKEVCPKK